MATKWSPSEDPPEIRNERRMASLRRSLTRLPVSARVSRGQSQEDYALPLVQNKPIVPDPRPVLKNDNLRSRTTNTFTLRSKNAPVLPSVTQARPSSETVKENSSGARLPKRRLFYPSPSSTKTPSLVSGSTNSTYESSGSALRRKASIIDKYALLVKTDPDSMQDHRDLVETAHKVQSDDDPFPGAIFGMILPPTSGLKGRKTGEPTTAVHERLSNAKDFEKSHRPALELGAPFPDAASSRHSGSPFSHQSTPTSTSSYSSFVALSIGSIPKGDSGDPPKSSEKTKAQMIRSSTLPAPLQHKEGIRSHAIVGRPSRQNVLAKQRTPPFESSQLSGSSSTQLKSNRIFSPTAPRGASFVGVPPEFAHLNEPATFSNDHGAQPRRPSRDGTIGLADITSDYPTVESNLSTMAFSHNRTPSLEPLDHIVSSPAPITKRTFGFSSRSSSRQSVRSPSGVTLPSTPGSSHTPVSRMDSPMVEQSPNASKTKMSILSRKAKDDSEKPRRGPAAGTGHEGYGKFGLRGRGSSIFGGRSSRSSSKDSSTSRKGLPFLSRKKGNSSETDEDMDKFLEQRKEPVVLRGTGSLPNISARDPIATLHDEIERPTTAPFEQRPTPETPRTTTDEPRRPGSSMRPSLAEIGKEGQEGYWLSPVQSPKLMEPKPPKSPTFFQRVKSKISNQSFADPSQIAGIAPELPIVPAAAHKATADQPNHPSVGGATRLVGGDNQSSVISAAPVSEVSRRFSPVPYQPRHEGLLPPPPSFQIPPTSHKSPVLLRARTATSTKVPQPIDISVRSRPKVPDHTSTTRLKPVGRIPQVVRTEDRPNFSLPFGEPKPRSFSDPSYAASLEAESHQGPRSTRIKRKPVGAPAGERNVLRDSHGFDSTSHFAETLAACGQEFFSFPPRKNSELSYTSSSGLGSPCIRRSLMCGEDEVWNEYDTLIDEVMPQKGCLSTSSSLGNPFQYADMVENESGLAATGQQSTAAGLNSESSPGYQDNDTSRPSTTFSISDYLVDYDDEKSKTSSLQSQSARTSQADTLPDKRRSKSSSSRSKLLSGYHDGFSGSTVLGQIDEQSATTEPSSASAELRFAALMTSKWLSFGRLLFSPAHEEAKAGDDTRILIIDGLGKEWSYHCALTYPKCQFYNLNSEPASSSWETLSNHHHISHPTISTPFPFPRGFFSAVVFRFPVASSDSAYQACFHEIKRTLRPSGYLETSVLDLDLVNMGNRARKAVRDLKIRMHGADSLTSLWNHGDDFLTLLGKRGFENIQRCVVGIPIAGRIRRSQDSSSSAETQKSSARHNEPEPEYLSFTQWMQGKETDERHENDQRNDEDITKTVAKIGRWWYSSCYPDPGKGSKHEHTSLWDTPGLLRECERQGTSFRLLFCYAQKPMCVVRRTASI